MKERPILFSGEMVRAIIDGRKTQTRRVIKPYGQFGDRLWVRETWAPCIGGPVAPGNILYRADEGEHYGKLVWRPSIHMPRWASRITLEVTGVRVERLRDITGKDIIAEGAAARPHDKYLGRCPVSSFDGKVYPDLKSLWASGWNSLSEPGFHWADNPWVWVIEFKRV